MDWNKMIYSLGDFFWWAFEGLEVLGNPFNYFIMVVGISMLIWWVLQLMKASAATKDNPTAE
ncbi:MAG: hypothetical protein OSB25_05200 [Salibacteraceae bacterium]|mgnify:FL=1|jgi:hypothetical protein|nr:hypothetical protein [Salibacteraceae bacterium]|tara:strand:+ start:68575 stop:68760 length:186 start_codon:yes stop_codon:yes gene_type:complete